MTRYAMDLDGNLDIPEMVELSNNLFDAGHEIYIVTGGFEDSGEWTLEERKKKLARLGVRYTDIIRCLKPTLEQIGFEKGLVCKMMGIQILFDDSSIYCKYASQNVQVLKSTYGN